MVDLTINNIAVSVPDDYTILKACSQAGIDIPTFCNDDRLEAHGACRICVVEVAGAKSLCTSCSTPVRDGMEIKTHSETVIQARKGVLELMIANHPLDCLTCEKSGECKLQDYCYEYGVKDDIYGGRKKSFEIDDSNPYYYSDQNKCIMCGKCVRICKELQCTNAIDNVERGFDAHIGVPFNLPIAKSDCVSCGNCVSECPVGALMPKKAEKFRLWELGKVETTCDGCPVGCPVKLLVKGDRVVGVEPVGGFSNGGLLCFRGKFGYGFINGEERIVSPLVKREGKLVESSWDEAYELIVSKIESMREEFGPDSFAAVTSGKCTNEENYLFQKLYRGLVKTNNIACIGGSYGLDGWVFEKSMDSKDDKWIEAITGRELIFILGADLDENNTVLAARIRQAKIKGAKLIVADPNRTSLSRNSDLFLRIMPGAQIALIDALVEALSDGLVEEKLDRMVEMCKIDRDDLKKCMGAVLEAKSIQILYSADIFAGTDFEHVKENMCRLEEVCRGLKAKDVRLNMLSLQNNERGALDMGVSNIYFPGYKRLCDEKSVGYFQDAWNVNLSAAEGLSSSAIMESARENKIKFMHLMACGMESENSSKLKNAVENTSFLVVQDIFMNEAARMADVVLPASSFAEKDGTFTNAEGLIRKVNAAVRCVGDSKPDWVILMEMMNKLGYQKRYSNPSQIMDEIASLDFEYAKKRDIE